VTNVSQPTLMLFPAPGATGRSPAVVVCPGGGYGGLVINREGVEIAQWLNSFGMTAIVLKYRVPNNQEGAFQDIERAVRLVRSHAEDWGIDPRRTGVIGFSAGGHLCARLSTNFETPAYSPIDALDALSCRPDFTILVYPAYLEKADHPYESNEHLGTLADELPIGPNIPPTFIVHSEDDPKFVGGSKLYHAALDSAHVPNEFALYPTGGHGYGLRSTGDAKAWPERCKAWLKGITKSL
jgi:acetyl esterase/lipase